MFYCISLQVYNTEGPVMVSAANLEHLVIMAKGLSSKT